MNSRLPTRGVDGLISGDRESRQRLLESSEPTGTRRSHRAEKWIERVNRVLTFAVVLTAAGCGTGDAKAPLFAGSQYTREERDLAVYRGLRFIYETAADETAFRLYASDYLWCFFSVAATTSDRELRHRALIMGRDLAERWRALDRSPAEQADADEVADRAMALEASEGLGVRDDALRAALEARVPEFDSIAYLGFDPRTAKPPAKQYVVSGEEACIAAGTPDAEPATCESKAFVYTDLDVFYDALITTYFGDRFGTPFGARFAELIKWRGELLPYPTRQALGEEAFYDLVYLVTHIVYTHTHYGQQRIEPSTLPEEHAFLSLHLADVVADGDPETYAEFIDTLEAFGETPEKEPLLARAVDGVLGAQNEDGAWGDTDIEDAYDRFHPTWTAIDALGERHYTGPGLASRRVSYP